LEVRCENCGNSFDDFVEDHSHGDSICTRCGAVSKDRIIDITAEKRFFKDTSGGGSDPSRTSKVNDDSISSGLGTSISVTAGRPAKGQKGGGGSLAMLNSRVQKTSREAKLSEGYSMIDSFANTMNMPQTVVVIAKETFNQFERKRSSTMRLKMEPLICAILYIAAKKTSTRTFKDIAKFTNIPQKYITEAYKSIKSVIPDVCNQKKSSAIVADLVPKICTELNLQHKVRMIAQELTFEAIKHLEGKNPSTIAAVCVWLTAKECGMEKSVKDVANAAGISHTTVRNVSKELIAVQDQLSEKLKEEMRKLAAEPPPNNTTS